MSDQNANVRKVNPEVVHKNFMAINQFMKDTKVQISDLQVKNSELENKIVSLQQQQVALNQKYGLLMARLGGGATST